MKLIKIKKRLDFVDIQKNFDTKIYSKNFIFLIKQTDEKYINKNTNVEICRFAPVATKKINKRAAVRNRIKRIIRDIIQKLFKYNNELFLKNNDYEIIARNEFSDIKYTSLYKEIEESLQKVKDGK